MPSYPKLLGESGASSSAMQYCHLVHWFCYCSNHVDKCFGTRGNDVHEQCYSFDVERTSVVSCVNWVHLVVLDISSRELGYGAWNRRTACLFYLFPKALLVVHTKSFFKGMISLSVAPIQLF